MMTAASSAMTMIATRVTTKVIETSRTVRLKRIATASLLRQKRPTASAMLRPVALGPGRMNVTHMASNAAHEIASTRSASATPISERRAK